MYIGRIVCIGMNEEDRLCAAYRVSSRSFPNRMALVREDSVSIVPKPGHEADLTRSPYISYNCLRLACDRHVAVVSNGSHTDPIVEKMSMGMSVRDAVALTLLALDYEKDQYNTPRICAVADKRDGSGWLGVVRQSGLDVRRMNLRKGTCFYIATYDEDTIDDSLRDTFSANNAEQACEAILYKGVFGERTNPITAVAAMGNGAGFELASKDVDAASQQVQ